MVQLKTIAVIVSLILGTSSIATAIYMYGQKEEQKKAQNEEILKILNNAVLPEIKALRSSDSIQYNKLKTIEFSMATKEDMSILRTNQNVILKYNIDAREELFEMKKINELTIKKAEKYDEIKKNEILLQEK